MKQNPALHVTQNLLLAPLRGYIFFAQMILRAYARSYMLAPLRG